MECPNGHRLYICQNISVEADYECAIDGCQKSISFDSLPRNGHFLKCIEPGCGEYTICHEHTRAKFNEFRPLSHDLRRKYKNIRFQDQDRDPILREKSAYDRSMDEQLPTQMDFLMVLSQDEKKY